MEDCVFCFVRVGCVAAILWSELILNNEMKIMLLLVNNCASLVVACHCVVANDFVFLPMHTMVMTLGLSFWLAVKLTLVLIRLPNSVPFLWNPKGDFYCLIDNK